MKTFLQFLTRLHDEHAWWVTNRIWWLLCSLDLPADMLQEGVTKNDFQQIPIFSESYPILTTFKFLRLVVFLHLSEEIFHLVGIRE